MKKFIALSIIILILTLVLKPVESFCAKSNVTYTNNSSDNSYNLKYAVVNVMYIMTESKAVQSVTKQINMYREKLEKYAQMKQDELQQNQQDLVKKQSEMSPREFEAAKQQFQVKVNETQKDLYNKNNSLEKVKEEALMTVEKNIGSIIDEIAKNHNYELVFQSTVLARYPTSKDISKEVVDKLNKVITNVNVKKPF